MRSTSFNFGAAEEDDPQIAFRFKVGEEFYRVKPRKWGVQETQNLVIVTDVNHLRREGKRKWGSLECRVH